MMNCSACRRRRRRRMGRRQLELDEDGETAAAAEDASGLGDDQWPHIYGMADAATCFRRWGSELAEPRLSHRFDIMIS